MRVSTEFPQWAREHIDELRDKQVLMYCTGGIRCERASAYMRALGHEQVFQLKGGIHNYLQEYADKGGGLWIGKNYTFDKRFDDFSYAADGIYSLYSDSLTAQVLREIHKKPLNMMLQSLKLSPQ